MIEGPRLIVRKNQDGTLVLAVYDIDKNLLAEFPLGIETSPAIALAEKLIYTVISAEHLEIKI